MKTPLKIDLQILTALAIFAVYSSTPTQAEPNQDITKIVDQLSQAKASGDQVAMLDAYQRIASVLAADPTQQDIPGLYFQADLQRDIARATYAIGADDPCPSLEKAFTFLARANGKLSIKNGVDEREILSGLELQIAADQRRMRCNRSDTPAEVGQVDAKLVGHYYLSGVMETGSELLLKADGRFDWFISYGAIDQVAEGRWGRVGKTVTLAVDMPTANEPLFRADQTFPWGEDVERRLRDIERAQLIDAINARCPWTVGLVSAAAANIPSDQHSVGDTERAKAAETKRTAETARDEATQAIAKAVEAGASDDDRSAAMSAMSTWANANYEMERAHRDAELPNPEIGQPETPPQCQLPSREPTEPIAEKEWRRGIAVLVGDPARELRLSRVRVTFIFSDNYRETAETKSGWAFASMRKNASVEKIILALPEPDARAASLSINPLTQGVQTIRVDTRQLVAPPFETMHLTVQGEELIPEDMMRGRYSRN
jgi:hypothetical protein